MAWQDAAFQNMPQSNYGQSQTNSIFSNQASNAYTPNAGMWNTPSPATNANANPYGLMAPSTPSQSQTAAPFDPWRQYGGGSGGQRQMPQSPYWQTGGGDPGNGQIKDQLAPYYGPPNPNQPQPIPLYGPNGGQSNPWAGGQQGQPQMQPGQGQNQLLAMLQQIMQQRGGQQGQQGPQSGWRPTPWQDIGMQQNGAYPGYQQQGQQQPQVDPANIQQLMQQRVNQYNPQGYGAGMIGQSMGGPPQQAPSGMSQQMPAFLQQLMQQRMMQQQFQQTQPSAMNSPWGSPNNQVGFIPNQQMGGGMNTGMGMPQGQQSNPFLQMLMGMQGQGQQQQNSYPNYQNNPLTNGANLYRQYGNSFV